MRQRPFFCAQNSPVRGVKLPSASMANARIGMAANTQVMLVQVACLSYYHLYPAIIQT